MISEISGEIGDNYFIRNIYFCDLIRIFIHSFVYFFERLFNSIRTINGRKKIDRRKFRSSKISEEDFIKFEN